MLRWVTLFAIVGTLFAPAFASAQSYNDQSFRVVDISVRLLYERSGNISEDVSDNPEFALWNTIIGEGSALEPANDALVTAAIAGPGEHNLGTPLVITVRDIDGSIVASRTISGIYLDGSSSRSLVLYDVGCAGVLRIEARLGSSVRTEEVVFNCGE